MWRPQSLFMSLVNHGACPFDQTLPLHLWLVTKPGWHDEWSNENWVHMQLQLEGSLWKTLILMFYGNAFLVAFPPAFLIAQLERPCSPKSKVQFLISFKNSWQIHLAFETNRENKIVHCCLPDCPVVGARRGRRPALLFITSSLSLHLQSSRLLAANTLCHFDKYVLPFWQMQFSNWTNTQWNLDNYLLSF